VSEDITAVHWPAPVEANRPPSAKMQVSAHRKHKFAGRAKKRKEHIAHADKNERRAEHAYQHKHTHTSADGQHKKRRNTANDTHEVSPLYPRERQRAFRLLAGSQKSFAKHSGIKRTLAHRPMPSRPRSPDDIGGFFIVRNE
jgi:hypothetical protein